jgi:hypothetical protein
MEQFRFARDFQVGRVGTNLNIFRPGDLAEFADVNGLEKSLVLKRQKNAFPDGTGQINDAGHSVRIRNLNPVTRQGGDTIRTFHGYSLPSEGSGVKFWQSPNSHYSLFISLTHNHQNFCLAAINRLDVQAGLPVPVSTLEGFRGDVRRDVRGGDVRAIRRSAEQNQNGECFHNAIAVQFFKA